MSELTDLIDILETKIEALVINTEILRRAVENGFGKDINELSNSDKKEEVKNGKSNGKQKARITED